MTTKKKKKPETELRWVKRTRKESLFYLVEVVKGTSNEKILEVFHDFEVAFGTDPDDSKIHGDDFDMMTGPVTSAASAGYKKGVIGYNFVEETTP